MLSMLSEKMKKDVNLAQDVWVWAFHIFDCESREELRDWHQNMKERRRGSERKSPCGLIQRFDLEKGM